MNIIIKLGLLSTLFMDRYTAYTIVLMQASSYDMESLLPSLPPLDFGHQ